MPEVVLVLRWKKQEDHESKACLCYRANRPDQASSETQPLKGKREREKKSKLEIKLSDIDLKFQLLKMLRQEDQKFNAILSCMVSSRLA